jgi:hypothetical protein
MKYKEMLEDINDLVANDFCEEMSLKNEYTQEEAREMSKIITKVYAISHTTTCTACRG